MTYYLAEETCERHETKMALDFLAGCLGGCAGIMVGYPLDTVKVHMQTQDYRCPKYRGSWHCFRSIAAKESVAGLYRGMSSPMAGVAAVNAIIFGIYGQTQRSLSDPDRLSSHFYAGVSAGIAQSPVCSPIELAKTRLQLQPPNEKQFTGPMECLRHIYKQEGYRGVFKGLGITLVREAPSYGVYFLTYEALTRTSNNVPISTPYMLLAGGLAGTASWVICYPVDVIKSRIQAESSNRYTGALDCLRQSVKAEGYACLCRGLNSTILRAFPTNAATFAVATWTFRIFGQGASEVSQVEIEPRVVGHVERIYTERESFLGKWNTFLKSVSTEKVLSRSYYSTLSTFSSSGLKLGNSVSCQADVDRYQGMTRSIKYDVTDQIRATRYSETDGELKSEEESCYVEDERESEVELVGVGQTVVECSSNASCAIDVSELSDDQKLVFEYR